MKKVLSFLLLVAAFSVGESYSKYGRTCRDIGCPSNSMCVMEEDVCTFETKGHCGQFPTCKRVSNAAPSCATYLCPPTQVCKVQHGHPQCVDSSGSRRHKRRAQSYIPSSSGGYSPSAPPYPTNPGSSHNTNYPQNSNYPSTNIYPSLPSVGDTYHQNLNRSNSYPGNYQGGSVGGGYTGYPGYQRQNSYPGAYPSQSGGYPAQSGGYPSQTGGYPSQSGGYPSQSGGYPSQSGGYPSQGSGYTTQGGGYGYKGQSGGYPSQTGGYPGYSSQSGGYQGGTYPGQQSGGYPKQTYPGGYPTQPGGYPRQTGGYPSQGGSSNPGVPPGYTPPEKSVWGKIADFFTNIF